MAAYLGAFGSRANDRAIIAMASVDFWRAGFRAFSQKRLLLPACF